ncbi:ribonuclease E [Kangiella spongicola]|uniref:Ribonuclease E n=2 Tax=Kangiella spongicola TaxID=796379 RepID=A0A318D4E7_9GAMM|nr:ribonuclease E [Kangiella spongicola]
MLINATNHNEELRVAMVDGQRLYDLDIELAGREQKKGNIYKGKVTRIEPSLEAAFVDYGAERHGFLPLKEVAREYMHNPPSKGRPTIKDALKEGQEIIVQIDKEERGNKGAALTTSVSLAGSYLVLMPNNPRAGGISRRIEGEERTELKQIMGQLQTPKGMGCIVRTAGVGKSLEEINYDFKYLLEFWKNIKEVANSRPAPFLITQESDVITRAIRDYLRPDIGEIIVDRKEVYDRIKTELQYQRPDFVQKVKFYKDEIPLFNRYQVESQIESAFQREVRLPSGGSVVFDQTEALLSIDINSAKATKGGDIEETALHTNKEAAEEIARQLRLRDIGGLIVIDFIDMGPPRNQREVEKVLKNSVARDRARIQIGRISRFGLLEMSRQRLRPSLEESSQHVCPRCSGSGVIRGTDSLGLSILRLMEDEAMKESTAEVQAVLPVEVATFLLNEKRRKIEQIEKRQKVRLVVVPNPHMETPHYDVLRVKGGETLEDNSYSLIGKPPETELVKSTMQPVQPIDEPALKGLKHSSPPPEPSKKPKKKEKKAKKKKPSLFKRLWTALFGDDKKKQKGKGNKKHSKNYKGKGRQDNRQNKNNRRGNSNYKGNRRRNENRQDNRSQDNRSQDNRSQDNRNKGHEQRKQDNRQQKQGQQNRGPQQKGGNRQQTQNQAQGQSQDNRNNNRAQQKPQQQQAKQPVEQRPPRKSRAERLASVQKPVEQAKVENKQPQAKPQPETQQAKPQEQQAKNQKPQAQEKQQSRTKAKPEDIMVYKAHKSLERTLSEVLKNEKLPEVSESAVVANNQGNNTEQTTAEPQEKAEQKAEAKPVAKQEASVEAKAEQKAEPVQTTANSSDSLEQKQSEAKESQPKVEAPSPKEQVSTQAETAKETAQAANSQEADSQEADSQETDSQETEEASKEVAQAASNEASSEEAKKTESKVAVKAETQKVELQASAPAKKAVTLEAIEPIAFKPQPYSFDNKVTESASDSSREQSSSQAAKTSS